MGATLSQAQHAEARKFFEQVDADHNGQISLAELKAAMKLDDHHAKKLILAVDQDHNKRLSYEEFLELFKVRYGPLFSEIDKNGGGSISHVEFVTFCVQAGATNTQDIENFLESGDTDKSGVLDFFEFCQALIRLGI
eukprot:TRINITY_DN5993_c0_g1_i1.p1 TRINITY_DN5993_c0_g1~~TRINITY_DN5993_c0_g1_i1.p1  ORF type:complete len:137 (+),score=34.27 TRINITY_DN5993_c0_g1_i1:177-587(+)